MHAEPQSAVLCCYGSENSIKQSVQPVKLSHLDIALYVCIPETNVYVSTPVCRGVGIWHPYILTRSEKDAATSGMVGQY